MEERPLAFAPDDEGAWERLARGYRLAGLLLSAHRLGLLRRLAEASHVGSEQLAEDLVADGELVDRMCRALEVTGLVEAGADGWRLTRAGRTLLADPAASVELDSLGEDYLRWGRLDEQARRMAVGERPEESEYGEEAAAANVGAARRYALRLTAHHRQQARQLVARLAPRRPVRVLDVAGGDGLLAREICAAWPDARCTVLELPAMAEVARRACRGHERIDVVDGDFLPDERGRAADPLPHDGDVVVLANVLSSLPEAAQRALLPRVAAALSPGGCVVSCETVLRADERGPLDVLLTAVGQAAQRAPGHLVTTTEQAVLLRAAGLAASAEIRVAPHARAVIGVRTAVGVEPAVRVRADVEPGQGRNSRRNSVSAPSSVRLHR